VSYPRLDVIVPPIAIEFEGCRVYVHEVGKLPLPWTEYQAALQFECWGKRSRVFNLSYRDSRDLLWKGKVELSKFKWRLLVLGEQELRRLGEVV
jgi:hypothetical protein